MDATKLNERFLFLDSLSQLCSESSVKVCPDITKGDWCFLVKFLGHMLLVIMVERILCTNFFDVFATTILLNYIVRLQQVIAH